jgi:hypothetical protein
LEAGLTWEEVWPFRAIIKNNLEKSLWKLRRRALSELILPAARPNGAEKIAFPKLKN